MLTVFISHITELIGASGVVSQVLEAWWCFVFEYSYFVVVVVLKAISYFRDTLLSLEYPFSHISLSLITKFKKGVISKVRKP